MNKLLAIGALAFASVSANAAPVAYVLTDIREGNPFIPNGSSIVGTSRIAEWSGSALANDEGGVTATVTFRDVSYRHDWDFVYSSGIDGWHTSIGGTTLTKGTTESCTERAYGTYWVLLGCGGYATWPMMGDWLTNVSPDTSGNALYSLAVSQTGSTLVVRRQGEFNLFAGQTSFKEFIFVDATVVPLPAAVWLLGTGLAALGGRRWLRRKISS